MCKVVHINVKRVDLAKVSFTKEGETFRHEPSAVFYSNAYRLLKKIREKDALIMIVEQLEGHLWREAISALYYPDFGSGGFISEKDDPETVALLLPFREEWKQRQEVQKEEKNKEELRAIGAKILPEQVPFIIGGMNKETMLEAARLLSVYVPAEWNE